MRIPTYGYCVHNLLAVSKYFVKSTHKHAHINIMHELYGKSISKLYGISEMISTDQAEISLTTLLSMILTKSTRLKCTTQFTSI